MKLTSVVLQLAAVAVAALLGSTSAASECMLKANAEPKGEQTICSSLTDCFPTAVDVQKDDKGYFVVASGCKGVLGNEDGRIALSLNSAKTELSGEASSMFTLKVAGAPGGYEASLGASGTSSACSVSMAKEKGTRPMKELPASAAGAPQAAAIFVGAAALAAAGAALAL